MGEHQGYLNPKGRGNLCPLFLLGKPSLWSTRPSQNAISLAVGSAKDITWVHALVETQLVSTVVAWVISSANVRSWL